MIHSVYFSYALDQKFKLDPSER